MIKRKYPIAKNIGCTALSYISALEQNPLYDEYSQFLKGVNPIIIENYRKYLKDGKITSELLTNCLQLARIDPLAERSGGDKHSIAMALDQIVTPPDKGDISDLRSLSKIVNLDLFHPFHVCLLNPTLGVLDCIISGNADLIIDDMVLEIKTTKDPKLTSKFYYQLIGYAALTELCRSRALSPNSTEQEKVQFQLFKIRPIRRIGVYFSRFGYLYTVNIENLIKSTNELTAWELYNEWIHFVQKFTHWKFAPMPIAEEQPDKNNF